MKAQAPRKFELFWARFVRKRVMDQDEDDEEDDTGGRGGWWLPELEL